MERVVVNRSFTLRKTFTSDGVAADPSGTPTVAVVRRSDGATVTTGSVTDEPEAGTWSITVAAGANTMLDTLDVTWTATVGGHAQTYRDVVEVAGGFVFTLAELKGIKLERGATLGDRFSTAELTAMRTTVEDALERELGFALVPRYAREVVDVDRVNGYVFQPAYPYVSAIRSLTVDGVLMTGTVLQGNGYAYLPGRYSASQAVVIAYEHGLAAPEPEARQNALLLAKTWLQSGPVDDRTTQVSSPDTGLTAVLSVPGRGGSIWGVPSVDSWVQRRTLKVGIA